MMNSLYFSYVCVTFCCLVNMTGLKMLSLEYSFSVNGYIIFLLMQWNSSCFLPICIYYKHVFGTTSKMSVRVALPIRIWFDILTAFNRAHLVSLMFTKPSSGVQNYQSVCIFEKKLHVCTLTHFDQLTSWLRLFLSDHFFVKIMKRNTIYSEIIALK